MNLQSVLWCALIVVIVFYIRFVLESADEKEAMTEMTPEMDDNSASIRLKMKEFEREQERMAGIKKAGSSASELSLKLSPTRFMWNMISDIYAAVVWGQTAFINTILSINDGSGPKRAK